MQIYMTHIWVRNTLTYIGFFAVIKSGPRYYSVLILLGSVVLTFLLANKWLYKLYNHLMSQELFKALSKKD